MVFFVLKPHEFRSIFATVTLRVNPYTRQHTNNRPTLTLYLSSDTTFPAYNPTFIRSNITRAVRA